MRLVHALPSTERCVLADHRPDLSSPSCRVLRRTTCSATCSARAESGSPLPLQPRRLPLSQACSGWARAASRRPRAGAPAATSWWPSALESTIQSSPRSARAGLIGLAAVLVISTSCGHTGLRSAMPYGTLRQAAGDGAVVLAGTAGLLVVIGCVTKLIPATGLTSVHVRRRFLAVANYIIGPCWLRILERGPVRRRAATAAAETPLADARTDGGAVKHIVPPGRPSRSW